MKVISAVVLFVALSCGLSAQRGAPSANPVSDTVRDSLTEHAKNIIGSAELMPADKYAFQPTPGQMTFGQLMVHIVQTNAVLCGAITGAATMPPDTIMKLDPKGPKDTIVAAV